jgi:hypothetical protein
MIEKAKRTYATEIEGKTAVVIGALMADAANTSRLENMVASLQR